MMLHKLIDQVEQESFSAADLVECVSWRVIGGAGGGDGAATTGDSTQLNSQALHDTFTASIRQLVELEEKQKAECERLQRELAEEEVKHSQVIAELIVSNKDQFASVQQLDTKVSGVSGRVVHLGDQLASVSTPRARCQRALSLMKHVDAFSDQQAPVDDLFTDKSRLFEAADIIQPLYQISQHLPVPKYEGCRQRIARCHDSIERSLIEQFVASQRRDDRSHMKRVAGVLSHFSGYSQCVDAFIEQSLQGVFKSRDPFDSVVSVCEHNKQLIVHVFHNSSHVMGRFVLNIFHEHLQPHIQQELSDRTNVTQYLDRLCQLYLRTSRLVDQLAGLKLADRSSCVATHEHDDHNDGLLRQLRDKLFASHLADYAAAELQQLGDSCARQLADYYASCGHQKRQLRGGLSELRREAAAVIGTKTSLNIAAVGNFGGRTFLSEETAINLLQESQRSFQRSQQLCGSSQLPAHALQLYNIISDSILEQHVEYAVELAIQAVPVNEPRTEPQLYFYSVLRQSTGLVHLMDKHYADVVLPLVTGTSVETETVRLRQSLLARLQSRLCVGVERTVAAACAWLRVLLQTEQRRADFRPDDSLTQNQLPTVTMACKKVVRYVTTHTDYIKESFDGDNLSQVLGEFGERFHRVVFEHLTQLQYNTSGAMCVICDVNEYSKCVAALNNERVSQLFNTLHSLCNLLLVQPDNLRSVIMQSQLDAPVLFSFVQLRADFKSARLASLLSNIAK